MYCVLMKSPKVSLDQWKTLQAVVEYGGFAAAAEKLHRSQSSVSYAVNRLQTLLGVKLLNIEGRKAVLSEAGNILLQRSRQLLDDACAIEQQAFRLQQGWEAEIRLGVEAAFPTQKLMLALQRFEASCGDTRIHLQEYVLSGVEDVVINHAADLMISSYVPQGYLGDELIKVSFIAVAHPDHPLHQLKRPLLADDLNRETHVVVADSGQKSIDTGWLSSSRRWRVASLESSQKIISNGLGFGWLPENEIKSALKNNVLKILPLKEGGGYTGVLHLVYAENQPGPATQQLAKILKDICKTM